MSCLIECNQFIFHPLPAPYISTIFSRLNDSYAAKTLDTYITLHREGAHICYFVLIETNHLFSLFFVHFRFDTLSLLLCQVFTIIFFYIFFWVSLFRAIRLSFRPIRYVQYVLYMQNAKRYVNQPDFGIGQYLFLPFCRKTKNDKLIHFDGCRLSGNLFFPPAA